jgi:nitroimidazol reductase NimA-like FMN-containing flavoprotein (pyridoxamine 5'-phosphate oxidase superfamily)
MTNDLAVTARTKLQRLPKRGSYDTETIYGILDEGFVAHVGFVGNYGQVFVMPTAYARRGDELILHGSSASRMMRVIANECEVCVTVTLIDGLVLARSAFHHSMNYRSVVAFGKAKVIEGEMEKSSAMRALTEHIVPGRWEQVRSPTPLELKATTVLSLPLTEASAKVRIGNPIDDDTDHDLNVWAGVLPITVNAGEAIADPLMSGEIGLPDNIIHYRRPVRGE